jgi:hypothetical protein
MSVLRGMSKPLRSNASKSTSLTRRWGVMIKVPPQGWLPMVDAPPLQSTWQTAGKISAFRAAATIAATQAA